MEELRRLLFLGWVVWYPGTPIPTLSPRAAEEDRGRPTRTEDHGFLQSSVFRLQSSLVFRLRAIFVLRSSSFVFRLQKTELKRREEDRR